MNPSQNSALQKSTHYHLKKSARTALIKILTYLCLTVGAIIFILPFLWMVASSLKPIHEIFSLEFRLLPKESFQWVNYREALTVLPFHAFFFNSSKVAILSIIGTLVSCTLAAYGFARLQFFGRNVIFMLLLAGMMLPYQVTIIPLFIFFKHLKMLNTHYPLFLPHFFGNAFFIFLLRQYFLTIPRELEEAAIVEGANHFQIFLRIILPLTTPALITVMLFTFQYSWNDFFNALIYLNSQAKFTIPLGLASFYNSMVESGSAEWHWMMAASVSATLPLVVLFFLLQKYFVEGITLTGLKG